MCSNAQPISNNSDCAKGSIRDMSVKNDLKEKLMGQFGQRKTFKQLEMRHRFFNSFQGWFPHHEIAF